MGVGSLAAEDKGVRGTVSAHLHSSTWCEKVNRKTGRVTGSALVVQHRGGRPQSRERLDRAPLGRVSRASECAGVGGSTGKQPGELDQGTTDTRWEGGVSSRGVSEAKHRRRGCCAAVSHRRHLSHGRSLLGTGAEQDTRWAVLRLQAGQGRALQPSGHSSRGTISGSRLSPAQTRQQGAPGHEAVTPIRSVPALQDPRPQHQSNSHSAPCPSSAHPSPDGPRELLPVLCLFQRHTFLLLPKVRVYNFNKP